MGSRKAFHRVRSRCIGVFRAASPATTVYELGLDEEQTWMLQVWLWEQELRSNAQEALERSDRLGEMWRNSKESEVERERFNPAWTEMTSAYTNAVQELGAEFPDAAAEIANCRTKYPSFTEQNGVIVPVGDQARAIPRRSILPNPLFLDSLVQLELSECADGMPLRSHAVTELSPSNAGTRMDES